MKVVVLKPNESPEVLDLPAGNRLKQLQKLVGGYIEAALVGPSFAVYCNEEGLLEGLPFNCFRPTDGAPLVGTLVAVKTNADGEQVSPSEAEAERLRVLLATMAASRPSSVPPASQDVVVN